MPIYTLSTLGGTGSQLRLACDGTDCQSGFIMCPGTKRQQLIDRAKESGFVVSGSAGSEKFYCPTCAQVAVGEGVASVLQG